MKAFLSLIACLASLAAIFWVTISATFTVVTDGMLNVVTFGLADNPLAKSDDLVGTVARNTDLIVNILTACAIGFFGLFLYYLIRNRP